MTRSGKSPWMLDSDWNMNLNDISPVQITFKDGTDIGSVVQHLSEYSIKTTKFVIPSSWMPQSHSYIRPHWPLFPHLTVAHPQANACIPHAITLKVWHCDIYFNSAILTKVWQCDVYVTWSYSKAHLSGSVGYLANRRILVVSNLKGKQYERPFARTCFFTFE